MKTLIDLFKEGPEEIQVTNKDLVFLFEMLFFSRPNNETATDLYSSIRSDLDSVYKKYF